jgi:hypothetical protein
MNKEKCFPGNLYTTNYTAWIIIKILDPVNNPWDLIALTLKSVTAFNADKYDSSWNVYSYYILGKIYNSWIPIAFKLRS